MAFLVVLLVVAIAVVVLVVRAASAAGNPGGRSGRAPLHRPQRDVRPLAPDDDPAFLRELERRTRRDDGSPA